MAKKVGIRFESIKGVLDLEEDAPKSVETDGIDKAIITKIQEAGHKVIVYAESTHRTESEEDEPSYQKLFIRSVVEQKLKDKDIPYDSVQYDNSGIDIDLNYDVLKYKNWKEALLSALKLVK